MIPDIEFSFESFKGTLKDYLDKCEYTESFLEQFISNDGKNDNSNSSLFIFFKLYDFIIFILIFIL